MTITGDFVNGLLVVCCVSYLVLIVEFLIMSQAVLANLMIFGFMITLSIVIYSYIKNNRDKKTSAINSS
jgi:preprotein translocase subunit SecF